MIDLSRSLADYFDRFSVVFWDFDGVIKESVEVKTQAYQQLFQDYGDEVLEWLKAHHELNGGVSRFAKIPLYLRRAGISDDEKTVDKFCKMFSDLVVQKVMDSRWVPGVKKYLNNKDGNSLFFLVTATPKKEIDQIAHGINITRHFREISGAHCDKAHSISRVLKEYSLTADTALMIGDSKSDFIAADSTGISFLLRRTPLNLALQQTYSGPQFDDFNHGHVISNSKY